MKKRSIAFLLSLVMLLSLLTPTALAEEPDQEGQATEERTEIPALSETTVAVPREAAFGDETTVTAPEGAESYQWQFRLMEDLWVNISGDESAAIVLTYAKVCNMLDESGAASLRCLVDGAASETLTVTVTDEPAQEPDEAPVPDEEPVLDEEPVTQPVLPVLDPQQSAEDTIVGVSNSAVGVQEETGDETPAENEKDTYSIVINYVFQDGKQAANPWTATVAKGSDYTQTVNSPTVVGYKPDQEKVEVTVTDIQANKTYTVTYKPALVEFTVIHYQQNLDDDKYTLKDTELKTGYTESMVGEGLAKTYEGFTALLYDTSIKIAADGSTVVEVYYDRNYYLMKFDLDGGYGVEPIYARYGTPISVDESAIERAGYTFTEWENDAEIPATMPAENTAFKAVWKANDTTLTVAFWYENANDENYSVAGTYTTQIASGTSVSSARYQNQSFKDRDGTHFTYNKDMAETITVKGDGSSVLNVYYTRNTYKLTFPGCGDTKVLSCGKVEHKHTHAQCCTKDNGHWFSCNTKKCPVGYKHSHSSSCYSNDLVITAKYDSDITYVWKTDPIKSLLDQGYVFKSSVTDKYYSFLEKMPGQDITMTKTYWSGYTYEWYYYLEVPAGMSAPAGATTRTDNGKTYYLYHTTTILGSSSLVLTYDEDYYPITGFTQRDGKTGGDWRWDDESGAYELSFDDNNKAYLYYTRNSYDLKFINYGTTVKTATKYYQADISQEGFVPGYPAGLEADCYTFEGWYTDPFFHNKFDFTGATMPAGPLVLYAYWQPINHTVKTYLTKDALASAPESPLSEQTVPHRTLADEPEEPENDGLTFVGWFYEENGVEKAFVFDSMPITKDLNLYAKWSSNKLVSYVIKYAVRGENGELTYIADDTTGSALATTTKTFDAKSGKELNDGYKTGYFPETNSHSLLMDLKEEKNTFTFIYVPRDKVPYKVRYLDKATGEPVVVNGVPTPDKETETSDAVITEKFRQITGYAPDAYQKRLVLSANEEENVLIFWYTKDDVHAPVQIIHWTQNIVGDGYSEYQSSSDLNGEIGKEQTSTALEISGFQYARGTAVAGETTTPCTAPETPKAALSAEGLVLNLYYDRIMYPYEFRFLEQGTNKKLADPVTNTARYQAQVTQTAKDIPGYTLASASNSQAINIAIEDPANVANKNVRIFYYTEQEVTINYVVVGPDGCGTLDNYQESQLKVITGEVKGSAPTATAGFKFVGWYTDKDCTQSVDANWVKDSKLTPGKTKDLGNGVMGYEAATYYAKFEYDVADLTITKTGCADIDENQSFIFTVTGGELPEAGLKVVVKGNGSVTIKGLKVGTTYTITEDTGWSWRYTPTAKDGKTAEPAQDIELQAEVNGYKNTVTFNNSRTQDKWLNGCSIEVNNWKKKADEESSKTN